MSKRLKRVSSINVESFGEIDRIAVEMAKPFKFRIHFYFKNGDEGLWVDVPLGGYFASEGSALFFAQSHFPKSEVYSKVEA